MTKIDQFIHDQIANRLQPGETIVATASIFTRSLGWFAVGGITAMMGEGYFFAALTAQRVFFIATRRGLAGVERRNSGVTELALSDIASVVAGGSLLLRTFTIVSRRGQSTTYKINTRSGAASGQDRFIELLISLHRQAGERGSKVPTFAGADVAVVAAPAMVRPSASAGTEAPREPMNLVEQFKELSELHASGVLTADEYATMKAELLRRI